jgi:hypothetical protein
VKPTVEQIGNLLALKRDERPEEGYWNEFLCEFHQKQREQAAKKSEFTNFFNQVSDWFAGLGPSKWAYGAGLAYAAVTVAFFLTPHDVVLENAPASHVNYEVVPPPAPPTVEQLNQLDLSPSTQGHTGEQVF